MINCNVVTDLLPVYLDGSCSDETKELVNNHFKECESCRTKMRQISVQTDTEYTEIDLEDKVFAEIADRVQKRRTRTAFIIVAVVTVFTLLLALSVSAGIHFKHSRTHAVYDVEDGIYNLTTGDIITNGEDISDYSLFTNYAQISVTVYSESDFEGIVYLYNCDYPDGYIMISSVDNKDNSVTFTGLNSSYRYYVDYEGDADVEIILSEGRIISFWYSFKQVVSEILGL